MYPNFKYFWVGSWALLPETFSLHVFGNEFFNDARLCAESGGEA
jgi:hypothetical protein